MADGESRAGGSVRSFVFGLPLSRLPVFRARRWQVWYWEHDRWHRFPASMPEGAAASYVDIDRRHAGAVAMEAV